MDFVKAKLRKLCVVLFRNCFDYFADKVFMSSYRTTIVQSTPVRGSY